MSDAVANEARDIAMTALQSQLNMIAAALQMASEMEFPPEVVREFLTRVDTANEAMIADCPAKQMLGFHLATMQAMWGTSTD